jgi:preprotein translocase SecF subunit
MAQRAELAARDLILEEAVFNIIEKRRWYFLTSGILIILSVAALTVSTIQFGQPLQLSVDLADAEATKAAGLAALVAVVIIPVFIWWSFRSLPGAFRYGVCTVAMLAHNLLITCGFYALMGILAGWEVDALFSIAILAVIGLSAQGVIGVFDRTRENISLRRTESHEKAINRSILEAINGSLATRLCAVFVMIAIILLGGTTIKPFVATILVGTVSEIYSSIFVAAPLLAAWQKASARRAATRATV